MQCRSPLFSVAGTNVAFPILQKIPPLPYFALHQDQHRIWIDLFSSSLEFTPWASSSYNLQFSGFFFLFSRSILLFSSTTNVLRMKKGSFDRLFSLVPKKTFQLPRHRSFQGVQQLDHWPTEDHERTTQDPWWWMRNYFDSDNDTWLFFFLLIPTPSLACFDLEKKKKKQNMELG